MITTSPEPFQQSHYFQMPDGPFWGFHSRAVRELGTRLGSLHPLDRWHTAFEPTDEVDLVTLEGGRVPAGDP